jgi:hypothetical protein
MSQTWSAFNQALSKCDHDLTTVGYMPLIQAPAHHLDTINTVVQRCMHIPEKLGQKYTVNSVDQALYFKLIDLKWSVPRYKDSVFPRLGGLHIAMNFMKCICDHMNGSGLHEIWVESDLLGPLQLSKCYLENTITEECEHTKLLPRLSGDCFYRHC